MLNLYNFFPYSTMKSPLVPIFLLFIVIILNSCSNKERHNSLSLFELTGKLDGGGEGMYIYLDRLTPDGIIHVDSTIIAKGGLFSFHTAGIFKGFYNLRLTKDDFATLILDSNERVNLTGNGDNLGYTWATTGSPDSKRFKALNLESIEFKAALDSLQNRAQTIATAIGGNQRRLDSLNQALEAPFDSIHSLHQRFIIKFIKDNVTYFSSIAAIQQLSPDSFLPYYIMLDSSLMINYPASLYTKHFHDEVNTFKRTAKGATAPDIDLTDAGGKAIRLSDLRGKTILIFFWNSGGKVSPASLVSTAQICSKFVKNNFAVYGVSFDRDKDAWLSAIKQYRLNWINVCDTAGGRSELFPLYNIRSLPYSVLIAPTGKIIDKGIKLEELEETIRNAVK